MNATDQYIILSWNTCSFTMQQQGGGSHVVNQLNTSYLAVLFCGCLFTVQRFLSLNILVKDTKQFFPVVLLNNLYPVQGGFIFFESVNLVKRFLPCSAQLFPHSGRFFTWRLQLITATSSILSNTMNQNIKGTKTIIKQQIIHKITQTYSLGDIQYSQVFFSPTS